jgi:hypothetical protein
MDVVNENGEKKKSFNISRLINYVLKYLKINKKQTCIGCKDNILNQEAHMDEGGCLYN